MKLKNGDNPGRKLLTIINRTFQILFQKRINRSLLLDQEIYRLTPLDLVKLIWKDCRKRINKKYLSSHNSFISRIGMFMIDLFKIFIILPITAFKGNLVIVPFDLCTNQYAFSYGNKGWHWNKDLAMQIMSQPDIPMEKTRFYRFFQQSKGSSYTQFMTFHSVSLMQRLPKIPFGSFPWGHFDREIIIDQFNFHDLTKDNLIWFENGENYTLQKEFNRMIALLNSVRLNGYNLRFSKYQFPIAVILKNKLGNVRFFNVDGAHRFISFRI